MKRRCVWAGSDPLMIEYHDREWGVPLHDDRSLFEMLSLEGAQAGLSWSTILKRRESFRKAFRNFDPSKISKFEESDIRSLMEDTGIIRNKLKILSVVNNAKKFLEVKKEFGSFDNYVWSFSDRKVIKNSPRNHSEIKSKTEISDRMSKDMKKRGFSFVGTTICCAFMQSIGMVNDHTVDCFRHDEV
jgi:DNA-3-methyladenine glycosylase I